MCILKKWGEKSKINETNVFVELGKTPAKDPTNNQNITFIFSFLFLTERKHSTNISAPTHLFLFCCCLFIVHQNSNHLYIEKKNSKDERHFVCFYSFFLVIINRSCYCEHKRATRDCIKGAVELKSQTKWMLRYRAIHPSTHWIIALNFFFDRYIRLTQKNCYDQGTKNIKKRNTLEWKKKWARKTMIYYLENEDG